MTTVNLIVVQVHTTWSHHTPRLGSQDCFLHPTLPLHGTVPTSFTDEEFKDQGQNNFTESQRAGEQARSGSLIPAASSHQHALMFTF